jgi:hypothetical protein
MKHPAYVAYLVFLVVVLCVAYTPPWVRDLKIISTKAYTCTKVKEIVTCTPEVAK